MSFLRPIASLFYGTAEENDDADANTAGLDGNEDGNAEVLFSVGGSLHVSSAPKRTACLFVEAQLELVRKPKRHAFTLIASRIVYDDESFSGADSDGSEASSFSFDITPALDFHVADMDGEDCFRWRDLSSKNGSRFFCFLFKESTPLSEFRACKTHVLKAVYESKNRRSSSSASAQDLDALIYKPGRENVTSASSSQTANRSFATVPSAQTQKTSRNEAASVAKPLQKSAEKPAARQQLHSEDRALLESRNQEKSIFPLSVRKIPKIASSQLELDAELFSFDTESMMFAMVEPKSVVSLYSTPEPFNEFLLKIDSPRENLIVQNVDERINHSFHVSDMAFVWNYHTEQRETSGKSSASNNEVQPQVYSFSLTFSSASEFNEFRRKFTEIYMQATLHSALEALNLNDGDIEYIMSQNTATPLENESKTLRSRSPSPSDASDDGNDYDGGSSSSRQPRKLRTGGASAKRRRSSGAPNMNDGERNTQLQLTKDRAFAVRGSNIGVFGFDREGQVVYNNSILNLEFDRKAIRPAKALLHGSGNATKMVMTDERRSDHVYELDLNSEKIVREWCVAPGGDERGTVSIRDLTHAAKDASVPDGGGDGKFVAVCKNSIFNADIRTPGFANWGASRVYKTPVDLCCASTTRTGALAVGSDRGELRLFDRVGSIAKTCLQGATEPFRHIDVSPDGRYILATFHTHLLLYDVQLETKKGAIETAFTYRMPKEGRPKALRMQLRPEHIAMLGSSPVSFTPATLRISENPANSTVVTSTGRFVVTWKMNDVFNGKSDRYVLKELDEVIVAEAFKHDDSSRIVLATTQDVTAVSASELKPVRRGGNTSRRR